MTLTHENYFSKEADIEYMSVSQWKLFNECGAKALATIKEQETATFKQAYLEGHLFEELVAGDGKLFISQHPEMISSRGATAGQLKAEYQRVVNSAEKFNNQKFFTDIINKCEKQVILTGVINDVKVKCCLDLFDKQNKAIYDIKCMKDFKEQWNKEERAYAPWYYIYDYVLQLAVYREIVKQNFNIDCKTHLIAATKEEIPDLQALIFDNALLDMELKRFAAKVQYFDAIKKGLAVPISCDCCDYCKEHKEIVDFREIK